MERHDFVGQSVHVEVKTTTKSEPRHEISRLDQLRPPSGKRLLFISVILEKSLGGDETLADRIDEILRVTRHGRWERTGANHLGGAHLVHWEAEQISRTSCWSYSC
jgi:Putative  PD-(D/E)XK family member, (DUF4420)